MNDNLNKQGSNVPNMATNNGKNISVNNNGKVSAKLNANPILSMLLFISNTVFRKPSTWIVMAIFLIIFFVINLIPAFIESNYVLNAITPIVLFSSIVNIIGICVQAIMKGLNIFKDTQRSGVELLILSKPITRNQVVLARFIFIFGYALFLGLINMIFIVIAMAIVGMNYYDVLDIKGSLIGGTFGGCIVAFIVMAFITISLSLCLSGKASTAIPSVILAISALITVAISGIGSLFIPSTANSLQGKVIDKINKDIKSGKLTLKTGTNSNVKKITKMNNVSYDSFVQFNSVETYINSMVNYHGYNNYVGTYIDQIKDILSYYLKQIGIDLDTPFMYLDGSIYYEYNDSNYGITENSCYITSIKSSNGSDYEGISYFRYIKNDGTQITIDHTNNNNQENSYPLNPSINYVMSCYIKTIINEIAGVGASGAVAVNYINPVSAFTSISGGNSSISSAFSSSISGMDIAYNYSINNFHEISNNSSPGYWVMTFAYQQADPSWGVLLVWLAIGVGLGLLNFFNYKKKDFK